MRYYFAEKDLSILRLNIKQLREKIKEIGKNMGESCGEGAETFHDNFAFEDGERQLNMLTRQYAELKQIADNAVIAKVEQVEKAMFGNIVLYKDFSNGAEKTIEISSYMVMRESKNLISYNSPLGKLLLGAEEGEIRKGIIGGKLKEVEIISIALHGN